MRRLNPLVLPLSFLTILTSSSIETFARIEGTSKGEQRDFSGVNAKVLSSFRRMITFPVDFALSKRIIFVFFLGIL
jgi:hypothetical protein